MNTQEKARQMIAPILRERAEFLEIVNIRLAGLNDRLLDIAELGDIPDALPPELQAVLATRRGETVPPNPPAVDAPIPSEVLEEKI
ncbi:MAG TPA: hypothetical protein VGM23_04355 [Armatimonadota bacterium]|jgi:hypothetical protein